MYYALSALALRPANGYTDRAYVRYEEDADDNCQPVSVKATRPQREKPFAAEYALLAELRFGRN